MASAVEVKNAHPHPDKNNSGCNTNSDRDAEISAIKKKKENAKKSEMLREIHKLSIQIQTMEREKLTQIYSKRSEFYQDYLQLKEGEDKMTEERKTEKIRLQQQLEKMNHMIKRFQRELKDLKATPEFVERLKTIMDDIEGTITSFKESQRTKYEELMRSEQTLSSEIQQLEKKFEGWSQIQADIPTATQPKASNSSRDVTKDLPHEVAAFDKFVHQSGGHRGGWDEYDHQTFLRYRRMYKGRIVFLDHVKPMLPTRLESEIRDHETWYQEYLFLNENKKHAIKKWREKKEEDKEDVVSKANENSDSDEEEEEEKKKSLQQTIAKERSDRFKQINAWKVQKELEKAMKDEKKMKEELEKMKKKEEGRKRQLERKYQVDQYKEQKQIEEEILQHLQEEQKRNEEERKRLTAAREIEKFRSRDVQKLQEKMEHNKEKEEAKKEREKRLAALKSQVHVEVSRDPNRLLKPTSVWKERLKDPKPSGGGQVLVMPHRAVPSWRKS